MAISAEEIIIDLQINDEGSAKTLIELEQRLESLQDALKNTAIGSSDFKKLQNEVLKADTQVQNLNKSIQGLDTEGMAGEIGKFGGGVTSAFTGVAALVGNTNEEFEQFTKNIVTGIAVAQGFQGATEAFTAAQKLAAPVQRALNAAMAANPIGLMVAAVAALVTGLYFLIKAFKDTSTETERNIKLIGKNSDAYKNFENSVKGSIAALNDAKIAMSDLDGTAEGLVLTINNITAAEAAQIAELQKNAAVRRKDLLERIKDEEDNYSKLFQLREEFKRFTNNLAKAETNVRETTNLKLAKLQKTLNNDLKTQDKERLKAYLQLQKAILDKTRESNNEIRKIELDTFRLLNEGRTGLVEYEIELLERTAKVERTIRSQQLKDEIDSRREALKALTTDKDERLKLAKQIASAEINIEKKTLESRREQLKEEKRLKKDALETPYNQRNQRNLLRLKKKVDDEFFEKDEKLIDKLNAARDKAAQIAADVNVKFNKDEIRRRGVLGKEMQERAQSLANLEFTITENLEVQKDLVRQKFYEKAVEDGQAANDRTQLLLLDSAKKRVSNLEDVGEIEKKLYARQSGMVINEAKYILSFYDTEYYDTIIDLEEQIALDKEKIATREAVRVMKQEEARLELIKDLSKEEIIFLRSTLQTERINIELKSEEERLRIKREFAQKRIQLEKDILKAQIAAVQENIDRELRLREGNSQRVVALTKRRLDSEKALERMALDDKYAEDLKLAVNNSGKQTEITADYEEAKKLIEDDYRQRKIKADLDGYLKVAKVGAQIFGDFQEILANQSDARIEKELQDQNDAFDAEIVALEGAVDAGIETEESKQDKLDEIERRREGAEKKAAYDKAKREKSAALVKVVIDTALAVVEAAPLIPLQIQAGILGASQAAVIASQPLPQLRRGGKILKGPKHENGGIPLYRNGQQIAEVEGGETIMTAGVANSPMLLNAASAINQLAGGVSFNGQDFSSPTASNGGGGAANNISAIVRETVKGISSIPVTNVATDTAKVDRRVKNIEARSKF